MPTVYLCDFDGTVSPADVGAALVRRFSNGREEERRALLERWTSGTIGHRTLTEEECRIMTVTESDARAFASGFEIDPAFPPFVREAEARGDRVMVVSEGLDVYLDAMLERAGLADLARASNRVRFEGDRPIAEFPHRDPECAERCGNCKAQHVRSWRSRGHATVMVGDGLSDRCGARAADAVIARGDLLRWCEREGLPARSFASFADVAALARSGFAKGAA
jgi:2,3-diketo-5-methylthio-1-phosphopentane phosphatase